jgi:hypothetical protein
MVDQSELAAGSATSVFVGGRPNQQRMACARPFDSVRDFSGSARFVEVLSRYRRAGAVRPFEVHERVR